MAALGFKSLPGKTKPLDLDKNVTWHAKMVRPLRYQIKDIKKCFDPRTLYLTWQINSKFAEFLFLLIATIFKLLFCLLQDEIMVKTLPEHDNPCHDLKLINLQLKSDQYIFKNICNLKFNG